MTGAILHITSRTAWLAGDRSGVYAPESLAKDGFIHCSKADQVVRVAEAYYPLQRGLVLLVIDATKLEPEIRWEAGSDKPDELFPHVYGPINLASVVDVVPFEPDQNNCFSLPASLEEVE